MKQAEFAKYAAYAASMCAKWAGDSADVALYDGGDIHPSIVKRFAEELRERALWVEHRAFGVEQSAPEPATSGENISTEEKPAWGTYLFDEKE